MKNFNKLSINGLIKVPADVEDGEFLDEFSVFLDDHGWKFKGDVDVEEYADNPEETEDDYEEEHYNDEYEE